ncbi:MAG TPA: 2Fe-2S iron-sulfur cluster-binding protein, partial [Kofleriaceae bacterium]|nr:2Fe-2S iron-sulfur cluster-binding protein [Kofleriaceae bacterium]
MRQVTDTTKPAAAGPTAAAPSPAPPAPPVSTTPEGMVALTIDGESVTVPKGTNVLEAARKLGHDIAAFC